MAVQANKRKRKHKVIENGTDDAATAVPKKVLKKNEAPNEIQEENGIDEDEFLEDTQDAAEAEEVEDTQDSKMIKDDHIKFSKDFKMMNFRTKLRTGNFITELRHFLYLADTKPKMIVKFLEKRGKPLELVEALDRIDSTNVFQVFYVCKMLQMLLLEILTNQKSHIESALQAIRYFLKSHASTLNILLKSVDLEHRKIALKLLTAFVCSEPQLGKQILNSYDILSNAKSIEKYLSHSKVESGSNQQESVRKCYIHFVLSFLVDGNLLLVKNIIDKGILVNGLISGLVYDDEETVVVVLSTLKKSILECNEISKTKKIRVFDLECCKNLLALYEWYGPYGKNLKQAEKQSGSSLATDAVIAKSRENIAKVAHEFMIMLLTSRKHGVAFDATSNFRQKHNSLQGKLIGALKKPWENPLKTELVLKIIVACPELARNAMRSFNKLWCKEPELKVHTNVRIQFQNFIRRFVEVVEPKIFNVALQQMTLTDASYWIKETLLPTDILIAMKNHQVDESFDFRITVAKMLRSMLKQYSNYMKVISTRGSSKTLNDNSLRRFKFDVLNHLLLYFPSVESILTALRFTVRGEDRSNAQIHEHMDVVFDILLLIYKDNPSFLAKTSSVLNFLILLRPLYTDDNKVACGEAYHNITLEMKGVRTMLALFPKDLQPNKPLFGPVVTSLIKAFVYGTDEVQRQAGTLLRSLFKNTEIFESSELEIDLWLEPLRFFDSETVQTATQCLIEVLQVVEAEVEYPDSAESIASTDSLYKLFDNIEKGLSVQAYLETITISKLTALIFKGVLIVEPFKAYMETVLLLMFHYYPTPAYIKSLYCLELSALEPYMTKWLSDANEMPLSKDYTVESVPFLCEIQEALIAGHRSFYDIFGSTETNKCFSLEIQQEVKSLNKLLQNERLILLYIEKIFFIVSKLTEKKVLQRDQAQRAADFLTLFLTLIRKRQEALAESEEDGGASDDFLGKILHYIFGIRLRHISTPELLSAADETHFNFLYFLRLLIEHCQGYDNIEVYTENYRLKLVKSVAISVQDKETIKNLTSQLEEGVKLIENFCLSAENCCEILQLLTENLSYNDFFIEENGVYTPSIFYNLLCAGFQRLGALKTFVDCKETLRKLSKLHVQMLKKISNELNLEKLEESLFQFLNVSYQNISFISSKFFDSFFMDRKLTKSSIKLACLLLDRNSQLEESLKNNLPGNIAKREIIYPLMNIAFRKGYQLEGSLVQTIYQEYKNGFMKTIEKPLKAGVIYKENVDCSIALIDRCMPKSECLDFTNKSFKFDVVESYQIRIIQAIYAKAYDSLDLEMLPQRQAIIVNFVNLMIQMLAVDLKKQVLEPFRLELIAYYLMSWTCKPKTPNQATIDYSKITRNPQWMNFCKSCLKMGMHINEGEDNVDQNDTEHGLVLKLLAFLCDQLYEDYSEESEPPQEPAQLFEMICTHSKFFDIVLSHRQTEVKTQVLHLLYNLGKKAPSCLSDDLIPVILGAYQARLYNADRYALALLQLFEVYDCGLQLYRPFIWGESAIAFYSLRADEDAKAKMTRQETSIAQVMALVDKQVCEYTLENFPLWRKLNSILQMPAVDFANPDEKAFMFGSNDLENRIELGCTEFNEADRRFCPKRKGVYEECYDPAFFVPLMIMCCSPEAYLHPVHPVQNGLLALSFAALSSQEKDMRLAAACVQLRYRQHFEQNKFYERPLWVQAYENIQSGLSNLRESWMKHKKNSGTPRVPYIPCLFVANTFNVSTDPTNVLYKHLIMYLRLKSSFNFETIPEFNVLFYSPEVEHQVFRKFIIQIIKNGVKTSSDLFTLVSTNTFKVVMGFYGSTMSSLDINLLILSLFSTCVKIPGSSKILLDTVGLVPWLTSIISTLEFHQFDVIEGLITIISNFWYALKANTIQIHNFSHVSIQIHRLLLQLAPHLSSRISANCFTRYINILEKTVSENFLAGMSAAQLDYFIQYTDHHFPGHGDSLMSIKKHGGDGCLDLNSYCKQLASEGVNQLGVLCISRLRSYIIKWWTWSSSLSLPATSLENPSE